MHKPLRWWVIPGALVVLVRVVTLDNPADEATTRGTFLEASEPMGEIAVLDAAGQRTGPVLLDTAGALVLTVPKEWQGRRGEMTVWRRDAGQREASPWLEFRPRVRADGTIPIAGLAPGRYDIALRFAFADSAAGFTATDVSAPGTAELQQDR